ncbi:MAG TPA: glycogen synthase [Porphyromonadaceae bacterium]|nr:glycogen synthase [Porphyromonadaceae bacterium]
MRILFITPAIVPYVPKTEVADLCRYLPQFTQEKGKEIRTFMPEYGCINERKHQLHEVIRLSGVNVIVGEDDHPLQIKVTSLPLDRMQFYFIDSDDYFGKRGIYTDKEGAEYEDNDARMAFYARGVLEIVKKMRWSPDIIHVHGWFSALSTFFLRTLYKEDVIYQNAKLIVSLYDEEFKTPFEKEKFIFRLKTRGVEEEDIAQLLNAEGKVTYVDLMKKTIDFADGIIQGSETINPELLSYAQSSGKPFLGYQGKEYGNTYNDFYDSFFGNKG